MTYQWGRVKLLIPKYLLLLSSCKWPSSPLSPQENLPLILNSECLIYLSSTFCLWTSHGCGASDSFLQRGRPCVYVCNEVWLFSVNNLYHVHLIITPAERTCKNRGNFLPLPQCSFQHYFSKWKKWKLPKCPSARKWIKTHGASLLQSNIQQGKEMGQICIC